MTASQLSPATAETIGRTLGIHNLNLEPFLGTLVSLGLLRVTNKRYQNTPFTQKYFIDERSIHWTRQYSRECVEAYEALTTLEKALASGNLCVRSMKHLAGMRASAPTASAKPAPLVVPGTPRGR